MDFPKTDLLEPIADDSLEAVTMMFPFASLFGGFQVVPGSTNYLTPGTYTFTVPNYNKLTVVVNGGGGGGGGSGFASGPAYCGGG